MRNQIVPVILAGGQGTRLWPMSRTARPKQFLPLTGSSSLFQETLRRVEDIRYAPALILTNNDYRFLVAEQAQDMNVSLSAILLEPVARNTAAAIAAAAAYAVGKFGPDVILHVLPSDHSVVVDSNYWQAVDTAASIAATGRLVTFGMTPNAPETGYGYIQSGAELSGGGFEVARFVEKPVLHRAQEMLEAGNFSWNSGMFMLGAQLLLDEMRALAPEVHAAAINSVLTAETDLDFVRIGAQSFAKSPNVSVDYAIFEKTKLAAVLPVSFGWSDLGAWDAVWRVSPKDVTGNASTGSVSFSNTSNSLVISDKAHVVIEGISDIAVIASEDAIFVGKLSEAQKVGPIVKALRSNPETCHLTEIHKTAYRPWGGYASVLNGQRFHVKRLFVKPGKKLSLQRHHHRSEHWIVVHGTAEVTIDGTVQMVSENQSVYLPLGCTHRLSNPGKILLELIEVQTGSYLGEDDIIRVEDDFGRV